MTLIPGSHLHDAIAYVDSSPEENNVLWQTVPGAPQYGGQPVPVELRAGQISLHTDLLLHGSEPNLSTRRRCGLTMRFIPADVRRTLPEWNAETILCRGHEPHSHFTCIARPDGDRIPTQP